MTIPTEQGREVQVERRGEFSRLDSAAWNEDAPPPAFDLNLRRNLRVYRRQAITVGLILFALLIAAGLYMRPKYRSEGVLFVDPVKPGVMPSENATTQVDTTLYMADIAQLTETMKRADLLETVIQKLPEGVWRKRRETVAVAAKRLDAALTIERQSMSFQVSVVLTGSGAKETPAVLNALLREFLEEQHRIEGRNWDIRIALLSKERDGLDKALTETREELVKVNTLLGIGSFTPESPNPLEDLKGELYKELDTVHRDRDAALAALEAGRGDPSAVPDPSGTQLETQIQQRKATLRTQMSGMTQLNPLYKQDTDELTGLDKQMAEEHARTLQRENDRLRDKVRQANTMAGVLQTRISQLATRVAASAPLFQRAAELTNRVTELEGNLHQADTVLRTARLEKESPPAVRIVSFAVSPALRETSKQKLVFAAAIPMALFGAVAAALILSMVHARLFGANDVERAIGFAPVAVIPGKGEVSDVVRQDCFLRIASSMESAYRRSQAHTFVFTRVGADTDLARLMQDVRAKLVDMGYAPFCMDGAALLNPERDFEEDRGEGNHHPGAETARPAGRRGESVSAARLRWLLTSYDMVLVEAGPLLVSALAEYAARASDVTIVVAESGVTPTAELTEAVQLLARLQVPSVGVIVEDLKLKNSDATYRERVDIAQRPRATDGDAGSRLERESALHGNGATPFSPTEETSY